MKYAIMKKLLVMLIIFYTVGVGHASAQEEYKDNFSTFDSSSWNKISGTWQIINETISSTGSQSNMIFEQFEDTQFIGEIEITANRTGNNNYAVAGFYLYYVDSDNFASIRIVDDNRDKDYKDRIFIESKGATFTITDSSSIVGNNSIEFDSNTFHYLKVVRLNKNIYVYFDNRLALTTEFKDENPRGKLGFDVYSSIGYFDNFYLRPISMKNASGYIDKINFTSTNPTTRLGAYTLRLEDTQSGTAFLSLSKFGKVIDTVAVAEGVTTGMNYENGEEGLNFKVVTAFKGSTENRVELEDVIYASGESLGPSIHNLTILPTYHRDEEMTVTFSIKNPGSLPYSGIPELTVNSEGTAITENPQLELGNNQSQDFTFTPKAAKTVGNHKLTVTLKLDEYTTVTQTSDYEVRALNPVVTTLSPDIREDNGIRGIISIGSAHPAGNVDWNTTANVEVFRVLENGKIRVYSKEMPVKSKTLDIGLSYGEFYKEDGRYLVTVTVGEMQNDKFFEIKGPDGEYTPAGGEVIPPTMVSDSQYPQIMMLLIGMVAALSVRNHMHPRSWSLPLDYVAFACGAALFCTGLWQGNTDITIKGMLTAGVGIMLVYAREHDERIDKLLLQGTPIHDFAGLIIIFLAASYLVLLIPGWNTMVIAGTLIVYYTVIHLHGERRQE